MELDGYAVGGLAVGETHEEMYRILDAVVPHLPEDKPTYLMGVGTPANILEAVDRGVDFFDCVYPTRNGRHSHVYTNHGKMNLLNAKYELDKKPIEEGCGCPACRSYSRAYIRHLFKAKEMLGMRLCVLHNLYFYNKMMEEIRDAIEHHRYAEYKAAKLAGMMAGERSKIRTWSKLRSIRDKTKNQDYAARRRIGQRRKEHGHSGLGTIFCLYHRTYVLYCDQTTAEGKEKNAGADGRCRSRRQRFNIQWILRRNHRHDR